jgi:hypothetical protein
MDRIMSKLGLLGRYERVLELAFMDVRDGKKQLTAPDPLPYWVPRTAGEDAVPQGVLRDWKISSVHVLFNMVVSALNQYFQLTMKLEEKYGKVKSELEILRGGAQNQLEQRLRDMFGDFGDRVERRMSSVDHSVKTMVRAGMLQANERGSTDPFFGVSTARHVDLNMSKHTARQFIQERLQEILTNGVLSRMDWTECAECKKADVIRQLVLNSTRPTYILLCGQHASELRDVPFAMKTMFGGMNHVFTIFDPPVRTLERL